MNQNQSNYTIQQLKNISMELDIIFKGAYTQDADTKELIIKEKDFRHILSKCSESYHIISELINYKEIVNNIIFSYTSCRSKIGQSSPIVNNTFTNSFNQMETIIRYHKN